MPREQLDLDLVLAFIDNSQFKAQLVCFSEGSFNQLVFEEVSFGRELQTRSLELGVRLRERLKIILEEGIVSYYIIVKIQVRRMTLLICLFRQFTSLLLAIVVQASIAEPLHLFLQPMLRLGLF